MPGSTFSRRIPMPLTERFFLLPTRSARLGALVALILLFTSELASATAGQPPASAAGIQVNGSGNGADGSRADTLPPDLTRADVEAWLDGFLQAVMARSEIAGGVVVVVKNGTILLQKGYGYADVDRRTPVDPERTLFRVGSISKVFTATAVMQLVAEGKLALDRDINDYLDFTIPRAFGRSITLRHLLTHTAGFEETGKDAWTIDPATREPLETYLPTHLPKVIYPPGEVTAYSNYGITLAGYIVQRVAHEPFDAYIERRIFAPLGMRRSTFRQPVPSDLGPDVSRGYRKASAGPRPFEICAQAPAGSLSSTGADMARFMVAHLQEGRYGEERILSPEAARLMHTRVPDGFPAVNGMALGFRQADRNGRRIIEHGGDTGLFHSNMALLLDENVGFYVSFNSTGTGGDVRGTLVDDFIDRYFPAPSAAEPATAATARDHARMAAGRYESSRHWESSLFRVLSLVQQVPVTLDDDGALVVPVETGPTSSQAVRWREIQPFVWQEVGGSRRLAMRVQNGRVTAFRFGDLSSMDYIRSSTVRDPTWNLPLLLGSVVWILATIVAWPLGALLRWRYGAAPMGWQRDETVARVFTRVGAMASLAAVILWISLLANLTNGNLHFLSESDSTIRVAQLLGLVGTVGAGMAVWSAWMTCHRDRSIWTRLQSILLAIACLGMVWFMWSFKLITMQLTF